MVLVFVFQEVAEIVRLTSSNVWSDRRDGVICLQNFLLNSGVLRFVFKFLFCLSYKFSFCSVAFFTGSRGRVLVRLSYKLIIFYILLNCLLKFVMKCRRVIAVASLRRTIGLKTRATFHPIGSKTKTSRDAPAHVFPPFALTTCDFFEF